MWTALMFDTAVMTFGQHVENKLKEIDESYLPQIRMRYSLRELIGLPYDKTELRNLTLASLRMLDIDAQHPERSGVVSD